LVSFQRECTGPTNNVRRANRAINWVEPALDLPTLRFPGQYYDAETETSGSGSGMHYNRFRTYDPAIGRYISAEPIGQVGLVAARGIVTHSPVPAPGTRNRLIMGFADSNVYSYALNSPTGLADVDAQYAHIVGGVAGGAVIGGIVGGIVGGVRAAGLGGDAEAIAREAARGVASGAALGAVAGAITAAGIPPLHRGGVRAAGCGAYDLFAVGFREAVGAGKSKPSLAAILSAFGVTLFNEPGVANGSPAGRCTAGPPGGDELAGQFSGTLGALNRSR
jgi:RHS repeat-associated protein